MKTIYESQSTPAADGYSMPAEFAPQDRVWMGWPHRTDTWAHGAKPAQKQYAAIARAISEFTPVTMCANEADFANCLATFEDDDNVTVIEMTTNDAWFRDTGATFVTDGAGGKRAVDWHFNAYGGLIDGLYFPWDADDQIAAKMAQLTGCVRYRPDEMILEGGSITVDGEGTVIVTDQCLLSPGRTASAVLAEEADEDTIWPAYARAFEPWSEELRAYMDEHADELCDTCMTRAEVNPLRAFDCKNPQCAAIMADAPKITDHLCDECREHYDAVKTLLDGAGVVYEEDYKLVRGLDYYTRTVFEVQVDNGMGAQNAIGGGGRYDKLAEEVGGRPTPGLGFALGFERCVLALEAAGVEFPRAQKCDLFVACVDDSVRARAFALVQECRDAGFTTEMDHQKRSLKSQFKLADKLGAARVAVLGPDELDAGEVTLRDMATHTEAKVRLEEVVGELGRAIL